jgi:hydrogenase-4 component E
MPASAAFVSFSHDIAHLLGGAILVLSFGLLCQRHLRAMINLYAMQAVLLAAAAAWQGAVQGAPQLLLAALIALAGKGVALPLALHAITRRLGRERAVEPALGAFACMAIGLALVLLAVVVVSPGPMQSQAAGREDLALALSVVLLGLLMMLTRSSVFTRVIGFLSLENGLILAAVGVPGMPMLAGLSLALLALLAALLAGLYYVGLDEVAR